MRGVQVLRRSNRPGSQFLSTGTENFGYQKVGVGEKEEKVKGVFASVASNYDVMNDLMSAGTLGTFYSVCADGQYAGQLSIRTLV
jgi:hypothetical protein